MKKYIFILFILFIFYFGCDTSETSVDNDFGIYLLKDTTLITSDVKEISLESLILQDKPVINIDDIVTYNWEDHIITLTSEAFGIFSNVEDKMKLPIAASCGVS